MLVYRHSHYLVLCVRSAPLPDLKVVNVSDEELHIDDVSAPEFAYSPIAGVLGRYHKRSMDIVKQPPPQITRRQLPH